jgi:2-C-methyl-D-erythritol 4-phosphate cytidylyltransferase
MNSAVIVAAGRGLRMGAETPKQYLPLDGVPILGRTLAVFANSGLFGEMILVVADGETEYCRRSILDRMGMRHDVCIVSGGGQRQESVFNGLAASRGGEDAVVLIHDGVRPFVTADLLAACLDAARRAGACALGVKASATLKEAGPEGDIRRTLPREDVWLAQTPQGFRLGLIKEAHRRAREDGFCATDDAQLVERLGRPVVLVPGSRMNIKITTPDDLHLAEIIWQHQRGSAAAVPPAGDAGSGSAS